VASRAHGSVNSVNILILKHWHGLVTDCHQLAMVPIVLQSAPIVSDDGVSVKLYCYICFVHSISRHLLPLPKHIQRKTA